jgi:CheY-like chemotaxis protein
MLTTQTPRRILLVEDEKSDRAIFAHAVRSSSIPASLQMVVNGQDAIDYLEGKGSYADRSNYPMPDLIVLDLRMPIVDGFEFLEWRSTSPFSTIPVIVFEGSGRPEDHERAAGLGAALTLTKPSRFDAFCTVVHSLIYASQHVAFLSNSAEETLTGLCETTTLNE